MSHVIPSALIRQACEAQEIYPLDQLEAYAYETARFEAHLEATHDRLTDQLADIDSLLRGGVR